MATRPSTVFTWANSVGAFVASIPAGIRSLGWKPGTVAVVKQVNQAMHEVGAWVDYLATSSPADRVWSVGRIVAGDDPLSSSGLMITDTSGAVGGIRVQSAHGIIIDDTAGLSGGVQVSTTGVATIFGGTAGFGMFGLAVGGVSAANTIWAQAPGGLRWMTPLTFELTTQTEVVVGKHGADSARNGQRVGYDGGLLIDVDLSPANGGYTQNGNPADGFFFVNGSEQLQVSNLGLVTLASFEARRGVDSQMVYNAEPLTGIYEIVTLAGSLVTGPGSGAKARIMQRTRGMSTTASVIEVTDAAQTNTPGSPILLDFAANEYFVEIEALGTPASSVGAAFRSLHLTIRKAAVE